MIKVIVQIPCFNEAKTLPFVLGDLPKSMCGVDCIEVLIMISHQVNRRFAAECATDLR